MSKKAIAAPTTYYVYTYAFPDGTVFYVGKGCNARIDEHEREARSDDHEHLLANRGREWIAALSRELGKPITLEEIDDLHIS